MTTQLTIGNRYTVHDMLQQGGQAVVFLGTDQQTGETVAIKELRPKFVADNPGMVQRFAREGEALRALNHPNIVKVLATLKQDNRHFIVMEYVDGGSLRDLLDKQQKLPVERVLRIALDLSDALIRAHRLEIIHRDLKPANVLLASDGTPRLTDFGVAHMGAEDRVTQTGIVLGTLYYLSPEACNGDPIDKRSDIWAFGVLLFEMLTGQYPFAANNAAALMMNIISAPTPDLHALVPEIPDRLVDLINWMLQKNVSARLHSMRVVGAEIEALLHADEFSTGPMPTMRSTRPHTPLPSRPYKFLNAYTEADAHTFFGRERETHLLVSKISSYPVVLVYGRSGTGKTSLVQAGLMPALRENGIKPVYIRPLSNPDGTISTTFGITEMELDMASIDTGDTGVTIESMAPYVSPGIYATLRDALPQANGSVLIVDQLEEVFSHMEPGPRDAFVADIGKIYRDPELSVKLVLSIREDYLAEINAFKRDIPDVFYNDFRLEPLNLAQARRAIIDSAALCNLTYEEGLVEHLLADLDTEGQGEVDPTQLQIVCDSLYESLLEDIQVITEDSYEALGRAQAILNNYLDKVLRQYQGDRRQQVQRMLIAFISSDNTKALLTLENLKARMQMSPPETRALLDELLNSRLVRRADNEVQFELAHEYLVGTITSWMDEQDKTYRAALELLEQGLTRWKTYGFLLNAEEMAPIHDQRDVLNITPEVKDLLVRSAVWYGYEAAYWLDYCQQNEQDQGCIEIALHAALQDDSVARRRRAARLAGDFDMHALFPAVAELLSDPAETVRRQAALSLAALDTIAFDQRVQTMLQGAPDAQEYALEAIANVQDARPAGVDLEALRGPRLTWRLGQVKLKRNRHVRNQMTLYGAGGGAIGALLGAVIGVLVDGTQDSAIFVVVLSGIIGLFMAGGIGFGFGTVRAINERRSSVWYVIAAALGGGLMGMVLGFGDPQPAAALLGAGLGLGGGMAAGGTLSVIMNLTLSIKDVQMRLGVRLLLGALTGGIMLGSVLAFGVERGVVPAGTFFGFAVGLGILSGAAGAIDRAERRLGVFAAQVPPAKPAA